MDLPGFYRSKADHPGHRQSQLEGKHGFRGPSGLSGPAKIKKMVVIIMTRRRTFISSWKDKQVSYRSKTDLWCVVIFLINPPKRRFFSSFCPLIYRNAVNLFVESNQPRNLEEFCNWMLLCLQTKHQEVIFKSNLFPEINVWDFSPL